MVEACILEYFQKSNFIVATLVSVIKIERRTPWRWQCKICKALVGSLHGNIEHDDIFRLVLLIHVGEYYKDVTRLLGR